MKSRFASVSLGVNRYVSISHEPDCLGVALVWLVDLRAEVEPAGEKLNPGVDVVAWSGHWGERCGVNMLGAIVGQA